MKIGVFDLNSFFWTLAGARSKDEGAYGLALGVLRYMRERAEKAELDVVLFASDGPPELPSQSWRLRVDPGYKSHRAPKDEAQRAELVALVGALESAGFPVVAAAENERDPSRETTYWFEADDIAFSAALKIASSSTEAMRFEPRVFSNDWDLAQVLAGGGSGAVPVPTRLFTTRGEERTAADVLREFGVGPDKLAELKALAGDVSDGYKPFPGEGPGKPGIGEKGAADILKAFGSAHSAMAAALSNLDDAFAQKGLPKRIPNLLRKGGEAALERGLQLAKLRGDVPVPSDFEVGDWEEAEALLLERKIGQAEAPHEPMPPVGEMAVAGLDDEPEKPLIDRTAEKIVERISAATEDANPPLDRIAEVVEEMHRDHGALPLEEQAAQERMADCVLAALEPRDQTVILTEAEFMAIAPLPALLAAGMFEVPETFPELKALLFAIGGGAFRSVSRGVFVGSVTKEVAVALTTVAACTQGLKRASLAPFAEFISARAEAMRTYGGKLTRV